MAGSRRWAPEIGSRFPPTHRSWTARASRLRPASGTVTWRREWTPTRSFSPAIRRWTCWRSRKCDTRCERARSSIRPIPTSCDIRGLLWYAFFQEGSMISRRHFLQTVASLPTAYSLLPAALRADGKPRQASDVAYLGPDRIRLSRLAMGTGTHGGRGSSNQTRQLGVQGLADLYWFGYDNGVVFWDSADSYGSHPHLKESLKRIPREKVAIMTKTRAKTAEEMKKDLDRFRQEIGTDYLDIVLLHAVREADWPEQRKGAMEVLAQAREKKIVRTHGLSCHSLEALKTAARTPWVP